MSAQARELFERTRAHVEAALGGGESYRLSFNAESSDFVRFNRAQVRQPTAVWQVEVELDLLKQKRHAQSALTLTGDDAMDGARLRSAVEALRSTLDSVDEDPYLLLAEPQKVRRTSDSQLPPSAQIADDFLELASGLDAVGILASGGVYRGYCDDRGADCWFESFPFHLEFSAFHDEDKATKQGLAGFTYDKAALQSKVEAARRDLEVLAEPAKVLDPGSYRAYLSPDAVHELLSLLDWGGFSKRAIETKSSPFLQLVIGEAALDGRVNLKENVAEGAGPNFTSAGFKKPNEIALIDEGKLTGSLISPRTAEEYKVAHNGAEDDEGVTAWDMAAGELAGDDVLSALDDGLYISNLWYTNFSDRSRCRVTGMTRFATMWVEGGKVKAPASVMRFDDSVYRILGSELEQLSKEREFLLDADTYGRRKTKSARLPGALVKDFRLVL